MPIKQDPPAGDESVQEVKINNVTRQHGTSKLASLQIEERVIQEFPLVALILRQSARRKANPASMPAAPEVSSSGPAAAHVDEPRAKHYLSLTFATKLDWDAMVAQVDDGEDYGEER